MLMNILIGVYLIFCIWGFFVSLRSKNVLGIVFSGAAIAVFAFVIVNMFILAANGEPIAPQWGD
ncbi:hypothetical protein BSNK01_14630 [Bacillaceae bacterium]